MMRENRNHFIQLYTRAQPSLERFICAQVPNLREAEDILQDVALLLWEKFDTFKLGTSFNAWAMQMARYEIMHSRRALARSRVILDDELAERAAVYYASEDFETAAGKRRILAHCLQRVSQDQQQVLGMAYSEGQTSEQIARHLGREAGQVRTQLCRLRAVLRKCVQSALDSGLPAEEHA
jgi:RNA polymerase sigma-70 factor (ECF subfamily)